eukprot:TRINITY_DN15116_c0_g1_i3.p1 TRINITY_DN15116_c0_g1~~TRINITY_DN15116_c0_g1_i3.p1  ORF type:complete len:917 (-),score=302.89 TRINITY_DN15116_c0_g1_i3:188-2938(-)
MKKQSLASTKPTLGKNMTLPKNIDCLISNSMKKCKQKQAAEELEKSARKEKIRLNKKFLSERNRMIRMMNARKAKKMNKSVTKLEVQPKASIKILKTQENHRAELGLELLDLKKKYVKIAKTGNIEQNGKALKKTSTAKENIKDCMEKKESKLQELVSKMPSENKARKKVSKTLSKITTKIPNKIKGKKPKKKGKSYIRYLIPEHDNTKKPHTTKPNVDSELMDNIKVELLSEISSRHTGLKNGQAGNKKSDRGSSQENVVEGKGAEEESYEQRHKETSGERHKARGKSQEELKYEENNPSIDQHKFSNIFQGPTYKSQNEKIVHISNINTLEDIKEESSKPVQQKAKQAELQAEPEATPPKQLQSKGKSPKLPADSEEKLKSSPQLPVELSGSNRESGGNPFEGFTERKMQELLKADQVSALIGVREQVLKYKESTEKKYISKMYKSKQYSFKTYQRKHKELEKWVTQEKEEIKKTKSTLLEAWRKTATMIDEVNQNTLQLRKALARNAMSYSSSNSNVSLLSSRPATDRNCGEGMLSENVSDQCVVKHDKSCDNLEDTDPLSDDHNKNMPLKVNDPMELSASESDNFSPIANADPKPSTILIEELPSPNNQPVKPSPTEQLNQLKANIDPGNTRNKLEPQNSIEESPSNSAEVENVRGDSKDKVVEEIVEYLCEMMVRESVLGEIPQRESAGEVVCEGGEEKREAIGISSQSQLELMQILASRKHEGIRTDEEFISQYIDELFAEVCNSNKAKLISEINKALAKSPLKVLTNLQNPEYNHLIQPQLPHEVSPIVSLSTYLKLENNYQLPPYDEYMHIHNKAIFDAANEALNLIRPYGLNGEPMPWSIQSRILFKSIADRAIIVKNIKNMVLDWASFEVGTLPKKELLVDGKLDEDYFAEVREKQLATLLAQEVI